jgi:undecaprenyl diphosphate synthase
MDLFMFVLTKEVKRLHKHNIRFQVIGDLSRFSDKLQKSIKKLVRKIKISFPTGEKLARIS